MLLAGHSCYTNEGTGAILAGCGVSVGYSMPAQLVALTDGPSILLDKPILLLGRDPECDIQLDSRKVSRRHCCIAQVGEYLVVRDLASTNGIRINGIRVLEGYLKAGDELTIGSHRYQIRWDGPGAGPVPKGSRDHHGKEFPVPDFTARSIDDDDLESCDQPIPLKDPEEPVIPIPAAKPPPPPPRGPSNGGPKGMQPGSRPPPSSPADLCLGEVLPEKLELAPASDIKPKQTAKPPAEPREQPLNGE